MTDELIEQAITALDAEGTPISARTVNRWLRRHPPSYRGCSFSDLLRFLRWRRLTAEERGSLEALRRSIRAYAEETAVPTQRRALLIREGDEARERVVAARAARLARGEPVQVFDEVLAAFQERQWALLYGRRPPWASTS